MADADNYKIKIKDLALFVRNVQLSPAVRMGHVKAFPSSDTSFPYWYRVPYNCEYNLRFQSRIVTFGGNLSFAHVQCHKIDLVVSKIKLRRGRDMFALMADADNYKIKIKDLALFV
jgi:hypothetical protein